MLTIGLFAQVGQVSVQTLRHYDKLGLLKPEHVDRFTSYRYYSLEQLPRLYRILALKELGLALEQIGKVLEDEITPEQMRGMLRLRHAELNETLNTAQAQLERVEAHIRHIEQEGKMPEGDVIVKNVEPVLVAGKRIVIPKHSGGMLPELDDAFREAMGYVAQHDAFAESPWIAVWHTPPDQDNDLDIEAAVPVAHALPSNGSVNVHVLPEARVAAVMYNGAFDGFPDNYRVILGWIERNGYQITGPFREVYYKFDANDLSNVAVEIQFPVSK